MRILIQDRDDHQFDNYEADIAPSIGDTIRISADGLSEYYKVIDRMFCLNYVGVAGEVQQEVHALIVVDIETP